jgi:hypothetical protein
MIAWKLRGWPKIHFPTQSHQKAPKNTIKTSTNHLSTPQYPKIMQKIKINQIKNSKSTSTYFSCHIYSEKQHSLNFSYWIELINTKIFLFCGRIMANNYFPYLLLFFSDFFSSLSNPRTKKVNEMNFWIKIKTLKI